MLAVASSDVDRAVKAIDDDFLDVLGPDAKRAAKHVIDLDAEENSCPGCGTSFRELPRSCPGCGLRLS